MTHLERELAAELKVALALREDTELILSLDATTLVGEASVRGVALFISSSSAPPLRIFAPSTLVASALAKSFAAWGHEYLAKLKVHQ